MRQVGGSLGIAVMGAVVAGQIHVGQKNPQFVAQFVSGYHHALYTACGLALTGALIAVTMVRKIRHLEPGDVREAEAREAVAA